MSNEHKYKKYKYKYTQAKMNMRGGATHMVTFDFSDNRKTIEIDHEDPNHVTLEEIIEKARSVYDLSGDIPIHISIKSKVLNDNISVSDLGQILKIHVIQLITSNMHYPNPDNIIDNNTKSIGTIPSEKCEIIFQRCAGLLEYPNKTDVNNIAAFGFGPCHVLIFFNKITHTTLLTHIDGLSDLSLLNNIYSFLDTDIKENIQIFITGGNGNTEDTAKIMTKLSILDLRECIIEPILLHRNKKSSFVNINIETGVISSDIAKNYLIIEPYIPEMKRTIINRSYGFAKFSALYSKWYGEYGISKELNINSNDIETRLIDLTTSDTKKLVLDIFYNLPIETKTNTFENYNITDPKREQLKDLYVQFVNAVTTKLQYSDPIFLIVSGNPGIGKTHLSYCSAIELVKNGKKCLFFNPKYLSNIYEQTVSSKVFDEMFEIMKRYDVIIYDDFMQNLTDFRIFYNIFMYCYEHMKSMIITTNLKFNYITFVLKKMYPHDMTHSICVFEQINQSIRIPWTQIIKIKPGQNEIEHLASIERENKICAGIIIESNNRGDVIKQYTKLQKHTKIKYPLEPYINEKISSDYYMHDLDKYDMLCMFVNDKPHAEQLIKNIDIIFDNGIKIIILSMDLNKTYKLIKEAIATNSIFTSPIRITERIKILFGNIGKF